jgi:DNA-binding NarL/FixJ family response regulator
MKSYKHDYSQRQTIDILLVDDHTMMREGTRRLLEEDPTLHIVGEAQDGVDAIACFEQQRADVVILDIAMKGMNGFGVARSLLAHSEPPAILVLTAYDEAAYVQTMLKLGVRGYWLKSARGSDIRRAVHEVAGGKRSFGPEIRQLLHGEGELQHTSVEPLTSREIEVLHLVVRGCRNSEIATRLCISIKTVETHLTSLYSKLGVQSRVEVIAFAQRQGLLLEGEP